MVENSGRSPMYFGDTWWGSIADPLRQFAAKVADFFAPAAEASRTNESYEICLELPGVPEDHISIHIEHNMLTVSGEKRFERQREGRDFFFSEISYGKFQRAFRLPEDADEDHVTANYTDGVLTIEIPKRALGRNSKKIEITKR